MPGKIKVRVLSARHLPVMDRSSENTDAFVEVKFGDATHKTEVCRKSLNPVWNSEWFRFDLSDDAELQDEPLQIRIMDYDTYSANDAIGKVYIDLNPLLLPKAPKAAQTAPAAAVAAAAVGTPLPPSTGAGSTGELPTTAASASTPGGEEAVRLPAHSTLTGGSVLSGWLPIYDTLHGIRGEVNVIVKVDLFSDFNKFRQSSCGVKFFCSSGIPEGYRTQNINGFVEELVVNDDPEYQWIDKIRTPRASNEARQTLFMKLSGAVQRKIGLKALELGGNAVVGYQQKFDLEGDTGIVVRGIGTAVTLLPARKDDSSSGGVAGGVTGNRKTTQHKDLSARESLESQPATVAAAAGAVTTTSVVETVSVTTRTITQETAKSTTNGEPVAPAGGGEGGDAAPTVLAAASSHQTLTSVKSTSVEQGLNCRRASPELEVGGVSPNCKGFNFGSSWPERMMAPKLSARIVSGAGSGAGVGVGAGVGGHLPESHDLLEYPFITLKTLPQGFLHKLGGLVSCRSVKLLDGLEEYGDTRDAWWQEIRQEVRSHARCLGCNVIVGYSEDTVIWDEVVVLCASGTAAVADLHFMLDLDPHNSLFGPAFLNPKEPSHHAYSRSKSSEEACSILHTPYVEYSLPYTAKTSRCGCCGKGRVPDVLFSTTEPPASLLEVVSGRGCLLQAKVLRLKKDLKGDHNAKEVSDALPFIEYEIHRQLINKLKVKGMNALFGLKTQISIGDRTLIGMATATACYVRALPAPTRPKLFSSSNWQNDPQYLQRAQNKLEEAIAENERFYGVAKEKNNKDLGDKENAAPENKDKDDGQEEENLEDGMEVDFNAGNKDTCVLEIDDSEDVDILDSLIDPFPPPFVQVFSTEEMLGVAPGHVVRCCQTFSQVWRGRIHPSSRDLSNACQRLLAAVFFKLRRLRPCIVSKVNFQALLDDENDLQLSVYGTAISLSHGGKTRAELLEASTASATTTTKKRDDEIAEKEFLAKDMPNGKVNGIAYKNAEGQKSSSSLSKADAPATLALPVDNLKFYTDPTCSTHTIVLSPLSTVPGAKIEAYLGNLNFFLIRETSSLREAGGLNSFLQSFVSEIYCIARAHVRALGGNALVGYFMSEFVVTHSVHKNQGQSLIHVGGDVVSVSYLSAGTPAA